MKTEKIKRNIKYNILISVFIIAILIVATFFYKDVEDSISQEFDKLNLEVQSINSKSSEFEAKSIENKRYAELWLKIEEKKKIYKNLKLEELITFTKSLAEKYSIRDQKLKISSPEILPTSIYNNSDISLSYSSGELSFLSFDDIRALQFVNDFINNLHGYPIVTNFKLSKEKDYTNQDLYDISTGKSGGIINGKLEFSWYFYNENQKK